jgi:hypothetical protein
VRSAEPARSPTRSLSRSAPLSVSCSPSPTVLLIPSGIVIPSLTIGSMIASQKCHYRGGASTGDHVRPHCPGPVRPAGEFADLHVHLECSPDVFAATVALAEVGTRRTSRVLQWLCPLAQNTTGICGHGHGCPRRYRNYQQSVLPVGCYPNTTAAKPRRTGWVCLCVCVCSFGPHIGSRVSGGLEPRNCQSAKGESST